MKNPLDSVPLTLTLGVVFAIVVMVIIPGAGYNDPGLSRWLHIVAGIFWIGLLYYFNFVQVPAFAAFLARDRASSIDERRGVLRKAIAVPGRGYSVDFGTNQPTAPGMNLAVRLTWEWSGRGEPGPAPEPPATGADIAGQLGAADSAYGLALADLGDALDPDALAALSGAIGRVRGAISQLRRTVRQLGSLAAAPARLASEAMAAARSLGNVINDLEQTLGDTRDAYLAAGEAAKGVAQALGPRPSALARAAKAKGALRDANQGAMDACLAVFDAIAQRKRRRATVRPGQSLADVAREQLKNLPGPAKASVRDVLQARGISVQAQG